VRRTRLATSVLAATLTAALVAAPSAAHAGGWFAEVEPLAIRRGGDDHQLPSMFTVSVGRVRETGMLRPFVAAGGGFINIQGRAGIMALARGSSNDGPTMLVQVRGMHSIICGEQGLFGGLGLGYRWRRTDASPFAVLATVEAGPTYLRPTCAPEVPLEAAAVERVWLGGGSVSFTVGF
jgi:hypothetical protein